MAANGLSFCPVANYFHACQLSCLLGYYNQASQGLIQTRNETDTAGDYTTLAALSKQDSDHLASGAVVWGKSPDKKLDMLVATSARDATMDELVQLVKSLNIA